MANYHLEVQVISRGKGRSVTRLANYISGKRLHDPYQGTTYYKQRQDVLYYNISSLSVMPLKGQSAAMMPEPQGSLRVHSQTNSPSRS